MCYHVQQNRNETEGKSPFFSCKPATILNEPDNETENNFALTQFTKYLKKKWDYILNIDRLLFDMCA